MALSAASCLHYWSSRYGHIPVIGGKPVHSRASTARLIDIASKQIVEVPAATPRDTHLATISGEERATLLLESARTNELTYSDEFDNAAWSKSGSTVSANATIAPDGTATADKIVEDSTAGSAHDVRRGTTGGAGQKQAYSVFAKPAGRNWIYLRLIGGGGIDASTYFNVSTGAVGSVGTNHTAQIISLGDGWYRCQVIVNADVNDFRIGLTTADATATYNGDGASGVFMWRAQHEKNVPNVTSAIGTTSAAVTRARDDLYWDYTPGPQAMMAYLRFIERGNAKVSDSRPFILGTAGGDTGARVAVLAAASGFYQAAHNNGSSWGGFPELAVGPAIGDTVEFVVRLKSDGAIALIQSINGGAVTATADGTANGLAAAWVGRRLYANNDNSGNYGGIEYAEIKIVKYADVAGATTQTQMDELRAFELGPNRELLAAA